MSEPTRADLRRQSRSVVRVPHAAYEYVEVTDAEFDRIARDEGYIPFDETPALYRHWLNNPQERARVLRELFTVPCETCGGDNVILGEPGTIFCPNCIDGRVLAEGVERFVQCCDECHVAEPAYIVRLR